MTLTMCPARRWGRHDHANAPGRSAPVYRRRTPALPDALSRRRGRRVRRMPVAARNPGGGQGAVRALRAAIDPVGCRVSVLRLDDCIALCGLGEAEVTAIAQHEHIPEVAAAELANYLLRTHDGELCLKAMICDDINAAHA